MLIGETKGYDSDVLSLAKSSSLHNGLKSYYIVLVKDKDGRILDYRDGGLRSLTGYFLWLVANIFDLYDYGFYYPGINPLFYCGCNYTVTNGSYSIVLGSGSQTFSPNINKLAAPIPGASINPSITYNITSSGIPQIIFYGEYANNSSSPITVSEFGLQLTTKYCSSNITLSPLLTYDTLSQPVNVPVGGSISVAIVINLTG